MGRRPVGWVSCGSEGVRLRSRWLAIPNAPRVSFYFSIDISPDVALDVTPNTSFHIAIDVAKDMAAHIGSNIAADIAFDAAFDITKDVASDTPFDTAFDVTPNVAINLLNAQFAIYKGKSY